MSQELAYYVMGSVFLFVGWVFLLVAEKNRKLARLSEIDAEHAAKLAAIDAKHADESRQEVLRIWKKTAEFHDHSVEQWNDMIRHYNSVVTGRAVPPVSERKKDMPS